MAHGSPVAQRNQSFDRVTEPVLMLSVFGQELRIIKGRGPRALLLGGGESAILDWPFPKIKAPMERQADLEPGTSGTRRVDPRNHQGDADGAR